SGAELLKLINQVLDLSKVEAGRMEVEPRDVALADLCLFVERNYRAVAEHKGLEFEIEIATDAPAMIRTDPEPLQQGPQNLLDHAFKFTHRGRVRLRFAMAEHSLRFDATSLKPASGIVAISVSDTGIGIPRDKQQIIFEAFQQADGTTIRKYGGTGLGLSI